MKDNKLLRYYIILFLYLIVAFFLETTLRIMVNVSFCLFSAYFYHSYRKKVILTQDVYFIIFLNFTALGSLLPIWRPNQISIAIEMLTAIVSFTFLLLSVKNTQEYLFLAPKWGLVLGIIVILLSILYFTTNFLPYINNLNAPLSLTVVFLLGFILIITFIRVIHEPIYLLLFIGVCLVIASCLVAGLSIFHNKFPLANFGEDALTISGVCFLTSGMLKVVAQKQLSNAFSQPRQNLSLLYFLKKIF